MPTILSADELRARFTGQKKCLIYDEAVNYYQRLKVHADGEMPIWLIRNARPNESEEVRNYRWSIYEAETQNPVARVFGLLEKIRRSPDWMIRFSKDNIPAIVSPDETLEKYVTQNYPVYGSLENWLFEEVLNACGLDPNAVVAVMPNNLAVTGDGTDYLEPVATIYNSGNVVDFVAEDYAVLKSDELSSLLTPEAQIQNLQNNAQTIALYYNNNITIQPTGSPQIRQMYVPFTVGQVYYVITTLWYQKWELNSDGKYQLTVQLPHNLGALPVFKIPGKFVKRLGPETLKRSPLHAMVPHLNKAARESNDLDAGVIMHLYLEKWRINNTECKVCKGSGTVPSSSGSPTECTKCMGTGFATGKSPFNEVIIQMKALTASQNIPVPPLGYVEKKVDILKLQSDRIEEHIYKALATVNMEHLADSQLNQSGTAKQYDKDEMNNTISAFANSLVDVADKTIYWINEIRYKGIVPNDADRNAMLPFIPVPEKFDVLDSSFLLSEYQVAKTAGLSSVILSELQKELAQKKFYANPEVSSFIQMVMDLDPFADKSIEEKSMLESQNLATKEDVILSIYIADFIRQATEDDDTFGDKSIEDKRAVLLGYATKKAALLNTAKQIQQDIIQSSPAQQQQDLQLKSMQQDTRLLSGIQNAKV